MATYQRPSWLIRKVANPALEFIIGRLGIALRGGAFGECCITTGFVFPFC